MNVTIESQLDEFAEKTIEFGHNGLTNEVVCSALRKIVEAGKQNGESDLSLRDIADQVKQKHHV